MGETVVVAVVTLLAYAALERAFGRPVPSSLRRLYADRELVTRTDFVVRDPSVPGPEGEWPIYAFQPASADPLELDRVGAPPGSFCFAVTTTGDPYYLVLGQLPDGDGPVFLCYHDGDGTVRVADSLAAFLSWPRTEPAEVPPAGA